MARQSVQFYTFRIVFTEIIPSLDIKSKVYSSNLKSEATRRIKNHCYTCYNHIAMPTPLPYRRTLNIQTNIKLVCESAVVPKVKKKVVCSIINFQVCTGIKSTSFER